MVQVEVDDVFAGDSPHKLTKPAVEALLDSQEKIRAFCPNFKYFLGFNGDFYGRGNAYVTEGDRYIVQKAGEFRWFNHLYHHDQLFVHEPEFIAGATSKNLLFAQEHNISVEREYLVVPHHAGVYPPYEEVFGYWRLSNVKATSTPQYPRLLPHWTRRGFIHKGIKVLPRRTSYLITESSFYSDYKEGIKSLQADVFGGEIFKKLFFTPFFIYMTHMANYINDRLAVYIIENVFNYLTIWTHLRFVCPHPLSLASEYFEVYPEDKLPIWVNPLKYPEHKAIWNRYKPLPVFPDVLVIGCEPMSFSTVVAYLKQHPSIKTRKESFEVSAVDAPLFFASDDVYDKGIEWYSRLFNHSVRPVNGSLFDSSLYYFSHKLAPKRIASLMPGVKTVVVLTDPVKASLSMYDYMRNNKEHAILRHTFFETITANDLFSSTALIKARDTVLEAGLHAVNLARWLHDIPLDQIHIIYAEDLIVDPMAAMEAVQNFLKLPARIDYNTKIRFDETERIFCLKSGVPKAEACQQIRYDHLNMDFLSEEFLHNFYHNPNKDFKTLLLHLGLRIPKFLNAVVVD